jgi:hypothetical protein
VRQAALSLAKWERAWAGPDLFEVDVDKIDLSLAEEGLATWKLEACRIKVLVSS